MNIHLPAKLVFTRGTRFWPIPILVLQLAWVTARFGLWSKVAALSAPAAAPNVTERTSTLRIDVAREPSTACSICEAGDTGEQLRWFGCFMNWMINLTFFPTLFPTCSILGATNARNFRFTGPGASPWEKMCHPLRSSSLASFQWLAGRGNLRGAPWCVLRSKITLHMVVSDIQIISDNF